MSLIARCPACQTTFRVVQDQLRVSEGWVRCGRCAEVFDAKLSLIDEAVAVHQIYRAAQLDALKPAPATESATTASSTVLPPAMATPHPQSAPVVEPGFMDFSAIDPPASVRPVVLAATHTAATPVVATPVVATPVVATPVVATPVVATPVVAITSASLAIEKPEVQKASVPLAAVVVAQPTKPDTAEPAAVPGHADLSFMRPMPDTQPRGSVWSRIVLGLLALVLLAVLAFQAGLVERARLASLFPQSKPALQWICLYLGCNVSALKQIESVVIDGSSFNKVRGDSYRLSLTLRNTSALEIAMPALELSLTDAQDQVLMRKVFLPNELGTSATSLAAGSEWSGQVALQVRTGATAAGDGAERFSGYRVLAFYP